MRKSIIIILALLLPSCDEPEKDTLGGVIVKQVGDEATLFDEDGEILWSGPSEEVTLEGFRKLLPVPPTLPKCFKCWGPCLPDGKGGQVCSDCEQVFCGL